MTDRVMTDECEERSDCADSDGRHSRDQSARRRGPRRVVDPPTTLSQPPLAHLVLVPALKSCSPVVLLSSE